MIVRKYRPEDLELIDYIHHQSHLKSPEHLGLVQKLTEGGVAWSIVDEKTGIVKVSCGLYPVSSWMCRAWGVFGKGMGVGNLYRFVKLFKQCMDKTTFKRVEMLVCQSNFKGMQLVELLGGKLETPYGMKNYSADDRVLLLYSITKD